MVGEPSDMSESPVSIPATTEEATSALANSGISEGVATRTAKQTAIDQNADDRWAEAQATDHSRFVNPNF
jgi:hypothetical protein